MLQRTFGVILLLAVSACATDQPPRAASDDGGVVAAAQDSAATDHGSTSVEDDPFNVSRTASKIQELGLPTPSKVQVLEDQARAAFDTGDCLSAPALLEEYAKQANWLANIITAGLEPFYDASYDDRQRFSYARLQALAPIENLANAYKAKRNRAMVMQAECLARTGQQERAVGLLINVLDVIPVSDNEWWTRARNTLYRIVEVVDSAGRLAGPATRQTAP